MHRGVFLEVWRLVSRGYVFFPIRVGRVGWCGLGGSGLWYTIGVGFIPLYRGQLETLLGLHEGESGPKCNMGLELAAPFW